jgi:hypothetical protein
MKRFRALGGEFDYRANTLGADTTSWLPNAAERHRRTIRQIHESIRAEFGEQNLQQKIQNFIDIGAKPFSGIAFHNVFFAQARAAFVAGSYYPSLTATCALGERILNHLVLTLREDFKITPHYKAVYKKQSFDNWDVPIAALTAWGVLVPESRTSFLALKVMRNRALHFNLETEQNVREAALGAAIEMTKIVESQFGNFGRQPWFMDGTPGESYVRKACESQPFVRRVVLRNCIHVGPHHRVEELMPSIRIGDAEYEMREITDEDFVAERSAFILR